MRASAAAAMAAAALALALVPAASAEPPWRAAERIDSDLFEARSSIILGGGAEAADSVAGARRALSGELERGLRSASPGSLRAVDAALAAAHRSASRGDETALAAARGRALAALRRGAYTVTLEAARRGEVGRARDWLLIRDFRRATRFTRPGVDGTAALDLLAAGEASPGEAATQVKKDLLDAYQARLLDYLDDAEQARKRGFDATMAENAAFAAGYWPILAGEYRDQRGSAEARRAGAGFAELERAALAGDTAAFEVARKRVLEALDGFTAAPFTPEEQARRASQLVRFLDLVPIEYDDGTDDGRVTIPFEIQEALAFIEGAQTAFDELSSTLLERDPAGVESVERSFHELETYVRDASEGQEVVPTEQVDAAHERASETIDAIFPEEWKQSSTEADFDLIDISLDQMQAAASAGEKGQAEQARLTAYAFFEFGPELQLRALDPQLVAEVEGLVWYGARGEEGLAQLIAGDLSVQEIRETRLALDDALTEARGVTGEGASDATMITNSALIVFREGLEAILIIAAITASLIGANRRLRRPIYRGALLALPASVVLWVAAQTLLDSLSRYGERLEAVVGLVAIGVLLLVLNWFFHRVYWTEWIAGHRRRGKALAGSAAAGGVAAATIASLYLLGFSSVFREGFETVLFLQALELSAGAGVVLAGVSLGLVLTAGVGVLTFVAERRLPYKRMLIVTGALIALVLVTLMGNTMRTLQGVGWAPITPVDVDLPLWAGTWLGVFPTVETLVAQVAALVFVIGSYFMAGWVRKRRTVPRAATAADGGANNDRGGIDEGDGAGDRTRDRRPRVVGERVG